MRTEAAPYPYPACKRACTASRLRPEEAREASATAILNQEKKAMGGVGSYAAEIEYF